MVLIGKKEAYAQAIVAGLSKTEACVQAGYSKKTAAQQANRLSKESQVIARIKELTSGVKNAKEEVNLEINVNEMNEADPKKYLIEIMQDPDAETKLRLDAAKTLMPYLYGKIGEVGKKETKRENAQAKVRAGGLSARIAERGQLKKVK